MNEELAVLVDRRAAIPRHVKAGELGDDEKLLALCENEKPLLDMIRMICYRVETRLAMVVMKKWNDKRAGGIVTRLFQSAADIIPEREKGILRARILGSARDSRRAEVIALFLSDVLILHVLGFHEFKTRRNFRFSFYENSRHVIYLGVACWKTGIGMKKCLSGLKNFDLRAIAMNARLPLVWIPTMSSPSNC